MPKGKATISKEDRALMETAAVQAFKNMETEAIKALESPVSAIEVGKPFPFGEFNFKAAQGEQGTMVWTAPGKFEVCIPCCNCKQLFAPTPRRMAIGAPIRLQIRCPPCRNMGQAKQRKEASETKAKKREYTRALRHNKKNMQDPDWIPF